MLADAAQDASSMVGSGVRAAFVERGRYRVTYMVDLSSRQAPSDLPKPLLLHACTVCITVGPQHAVWNHLRWWEPSNDRSWQDGREKMRAASEKTDITPRRVYRSRDSYAPSNGRKVASRCPSSHVNFPSRLYKATTAFLLLCSVDIPVVRNDADRRTTKNIA